VAIIQTDVAIERKEYPVVDVRQSFITARAMEDDSDEAIIVSRDFDPQL
jgi:hypothetical protein